MDKMIIQHIPDCEVISFDFDETKEKIEFAKSLSGAFGDGLTNMQFINKITHTKSYYLLDCVHAYFKIHKDYFDMMNEILRLYMPQHSYVFDNGNDYFIVNLPYSVIYRICDSARLLSNNEYTRKKYTAFLEYIDEYCIYDESTSKEHINTAVTFDIKAAKKDLDELERLGISTNIRTNYLLDDSIEKQFIVPKPPLMGDVTRDYKLRYLDDFSKTCKLQLDNFNKYKVVSMLGNYVVDHQYLTITARDMQKIVDLLNDDSLIYGNLYDLAENIYQEWIYTFRKYEKFV